MISHRGRIQTVLAVLWKQDATDNAVTLTHSRSRGLDSCRRAPASSGETATRRQGEGMVAGEPQLSLSRLLEIAQIGRHLILAGRHQVAVAAEEIVLLADNDVIVVLGALVILPQHLAFAAIGLGHGPGPRQRMVDRGDFVMKEVGVILVEIDALLDDALIVRMKRQPAVFVGARPLEVAGLDFERVETAVAIAIEPFADRIAGI